MKLSVILIGIGLILIIIGSLLLFLTITSWEQWIINLELSGMIIIIIVSAVLIVVGILIIIKFIS